MIIIIPVAIIVFLTLSSGFFSASEAALFSLSNVKLKTYQTNKNPRLRLIANLVLHPRDLLVTVFMLNALVNLLLQNATSHIFGDLAGWTYTVGIPLALTLIFGEIIPKYIGLVNNTVFSYHVAPMIAFLQRLLSPLRKVIIAVTAPISRVMFFFLKKEAIISKEELHHMLHTSKQQGVVHSDEAELIEGFLNLQDSQVKELMRPREEILFYSINEPLSKLTYLFVDLQCTRVPVINKSIDDILGIIAADDFFIHRREILLPNDLTKVLEKPFYIPETIPARTLLRKLDEQNDEMALVVDEYGSISGLITYEDLIEVVVGEITDLRDQNQLFTKAGENVIIASGKLEISEFEEIFDVVLPNENHLVTVAGWLTDQLGDIPKSGTKFQTSEFLFQILSADPNRITRVYIRKLKPQEPNLSKNKS